MSNPTSNFGWVMPTNTDLVTDLPADFAVFGQAVDTSMADLLGGTTGQILSKASGTNMDFTWIANDQGDITAVTTTAPLQGGGSSGALALTVDAASTSASGVVQLSNSTSTTSSVLAATPTAVKSAYDLADAAIAKTTVTTAGDVIYRNATVPTRLGIGTAGQVLTVNSGATAPQWSTPASGGKVLQVVSASYSTATATTSTSLVDSGITATITPSAASSKILIHYSFQLMRQNSTDIDSASYFQLVRTATNIGGELTVENYNQGTNNQLIYPLSYNFYDSPSTTSATTYKIQFRSNSSSITSTMQVSSRPSQIILMEIGA